MIDCVFITGKNYYVQVSLEEYKYVLIERTIPKYMANDIEIPSDSDRENSDEEKSDDENSNEENEKIFFINLYIYIYIYIYISGK